MCVGAGRHCDDEKNHGRNDQQALCHGDESHCRIVKSHAREGLEPTTCGAGQVRARLPQVLASKLVF